MPNPNPDSDLVYITPPPPGSEAAIQQQQKKLEAQHYQFRALQQQRTENLAADIYARLCPLNFSDEEAMKIAFKKAHLFSSQVWGVSAVYEPPSGDPKNKKPIKTLNVEGLPDNLGSGL